MDHPTSTYRLQLHPGGVDFEGVRTLLPYLERLGVSHLYLSPVFAARPGSPHGYDVVEPTRLNPELGDEADFRALAEEATGRGLGILLDLVPNHMAAHHLNPWWWEVLEQGPEAPHARYFDIHREVGPLLLPVLADPYAEVLERGDLVLTLEEPGLVIRYHDHRFPVNPASYPLVLGERPPRPVRRADPGELGNLRERKRRVRAYLENRLEEFRDADRMHELIEAQHYRPVHWELSLERLSHRRFFDILHLVGVRVEDPEVFAATHALALELVAEDLVEGLRIDHVDGLRDPTWYLHRLDEALGEGSGTGGDTPSTDRPYLVVEKILAEEEQLPEEWAADGTTGYEFLSVLGRLFVDPEGFDRLQRTYHGFTGFETRFPDVVYTQKRRMATGRFTPEMRRLQERLTSLAATDRLGRDVIPSQLTEALVEVTACLPVYRTYTRTFQVTDRDRSVVNRALRQARERRPDLGERALTVVGRILLLEEEDPGWLEFVLEWQQLTGAVMAKGMEDTALYVYNPLLSLNEVGSNPEPFPPSPLEAFHRHNQRTTSGRPRTMTTLSTHDTKRSEDVRARLHVLSHLPERWADCLSRWAEINRPHRREVGGLRVPTREEEILLYQTLVGAWPLHESERPAFLERLEAYLVKAAREAKVNTDWIDPDLEHEKALTSYARAVLDDPSFVNDLDALVGEVARRGVSISLAQKILHIASPGVPDVYRGTELWDLSLADPDNRRPVDFQARSGLLDELERRAGEPGLFLELLEHWEDGRVKLYTTWKALRARRESPVLFREGAYLPLEAPSGLVAFARRHAGQWAVVLGEIGKAEERSIRLAEGAPGRWRELLTGAETEGRTLQLEEDVPAALWLPVP